MLPGYTHCENLITINDTVRFMDEEPLYDFRLSPDAKDTMINPEFLDDFWWDCDTEWEIRNDSLFLIRIERIIRLADKHGEIYATGSKIISPKLISLKWEYPVFAYWYSDTITIQSGKQLPYGHIGTIRYYELERHLEIQKGIVVSRKEVDNSGLDEFRSGEDIDWCGLDAIEEVYENWIDARLLSYPLLATIAIGDSSFVTRGIAMCGNAARWKTLLIPETPMTDEIELWLDYQSFCSDSFDSIFIEVEAVILDTITDNDEIKIKILNYRTLNKNESIHSALFPVIYKILGLERY